ncbi:hypothetical protein EI555_009981 [Monodon monoceros]|uniref:HTH CENPB-type domain-containing protein n=1 Tax=Monodon monoceros TaxID=40151 RepID=A0A4U1FR24_MONMO|nr:hypothetical protein EI555_009981 [Monodon monoceros]
MLIQEKAKSLCVDLKKKHSEESEGTSFNASHGWFHRFKVRANLHNVKFDSFRKIALDYFQENLCKCSAPTADLNHSPMGGFQKMGTIRCGTVYTIAPPSHAFGNNVLLKLSSRACLREQHSLEFC